MNSQLTPINSDQPAAELSTLGGWTRDQYVSAVAWLMEHGKLPDPTALSKLTAMLALMEFKVAFTKESGDKVPPPLAHPLPAYLTPPKRWVNQAFTQAHEQLFRMKPVVKH